MKKLDLNYYNSELENINESVNWIESKLQNISEILELLEEKLISSLDLEERQIIEERICRLISDHNYLIVQLRQEKSRTDSLMRQFVAEML